MTTHHPIFSVVMLPNHPFTMEQVGVEDITDAIEAFEDEVQSVDMTTMNRL